MTQQVVLAVGHGSRVAEAIVQFQEFVMALAARIEQPVSACFLELADPDLADGLSRAAQQAGAGGQVMVLPMFLGSAGHYKNDVPSGLHWARTSFPEVDFRYATPLGVHARLVELLLLRIREAEQADQGRLPASETSLLIVGRGSSDPGANSELARLAYLAGCGQSYLSVEYAFQAVAHPTMGEAVQQKSHTRR
jgi:sirohydrochlorin cobaltochelatase